MFQAITKFFRITALWVLILPYIFTYAGAASNQLVLVANHDTFPVMANARKINDRGLNCSSGVVCMIDDTHSVMTSATHLNFLADIFDFKDGIYSVGDGLLYLGDWLSGFCVFVWMALVIQKLRATK